MALFETLTDAFTGRPAKEAADKMRQYLSGVQSQGNADIGSGLTNATGYLRAGTAGARGDINTGYADATDYLRDAQAPLAGLGRKYGVGTNLYLDALGVNGAEGNARAQAAFQAGPGYEFQRDAGIDALVRAANARGMGASGNTDRDAITFASDLAKTAYGDWRNSLGSLINPELSATTGASGVSRDLANLASSRGSMLADLASREGTGLAGLETGAANSKVGLATNLAQPYAQTYQNEANAATQGSTNLWNFGLSLAHLARGGDKSNKPTPLKA